MKSIQEMTDTILAKTDHSEQGLAVLVGTTQPTIHRIRRGLTKDPGYQVGRAIETLYLSLDTSEESAA